MNKETYKYIESIILILVCSFFFVGLAKTYFRTRLKGELLRAIGTFLLIWSLVTETSSVGIVGFIVFNVGWIMLVTVEFEISREIFSQTTPFQRLIGDVPTRNIITIKHKYYDKKAGIWTGFACIIFALMKIGLSSSLSLIDFVVFGIMAIAGVFFVAYSLFKY